MGHKVTISSLPGTYAGAPSIAQKTGNEIVNYQRVLLGSLIYVSIF